jgi:hypothetical protein
MKKWYKSKTLWVNIIAIAGIIVRAELGYVLIPEGEVALLALINLVLRVITKEEIDWSQK